MSKKKGTTLSLAEFAGDAYGSNLLPTESKGIERLDSNRPPRDSSARWGDDRPPRGPRDDSEGGLGSRSSSRRGDEGGAEAETSRADETSNWRTGGAPQRAPPGGTESSSFRSTRSREHADSGAGAQDDDRDWRSGPRREAASSSLTPTTSFGSRVSDRKSESSDSTSGNWRDVLKKTPASSSRADAGDKWTPGLKRTASASGPALTPVAEQPQQPKKAEVVAAVNWEEEEETVEVDVAKLEGFVGRFEALLKDEGKKFEAFAKKAGESFTASELSTNIPLKKAVETVFNFLAVEQEGEDEETMMLQMIKTMKRCGVVFQQLQMAMKDNQFEVKMLVLTQKLAQRRNFARISPKCSLLEAVWLALYEAQVVSEEAFTVWTEKGASLDYLLDKEETAAICGDLGRSTALFQTQALRQWLLSSEEEKKQTKTSGAVNWGSEDEEEDVDAELESYLSQTISRSSAKGGAVSIKKTISAAAARR